MTATVKAGAALTLLVWVGLAALTLWVAHAARYDTETSRRNMDPR